RLLQEITGVYRPQLCQVRRDACQACCESFTPTHSEINPVIASLLYQLADRVMARGGVAGCPTGQAAALQSWATVNLEIEHPKHHLSRKPERATKPCCYLGPKIREQESVARSLGLEIKGQGS